MKTTARTWLFRVLSVVLVPAVFLLLLEHGLKVFGYGVSTSLAHRTEVRGETRWLSNPHFTRSFFPAQLRREVMPFSLLTQKDEDTVRVFLLGASAANGVPEPAYGMGRMLETMLDASSDSHDFEVVNVAITAVNSHVVRRIAAQCRDLDPDLFVVYLGNNEVVGPYGAGTVFTPLASNMKVIRGDIALKSTRTGQLLNALTRRLAKNDDLPLAWGGMAMFLDNQVPADDPRMDLVYAHYERNLRDICQMGIDEGIPVIVSSVGVNLRDSAPFASMGTGEASAEEWFARGRVELESGDAGAAHRSFARARDLDSLRFRADSRIDAIVRDVTIGREDEGVVFVDARAALEDASPDGIPGRESFFEHVHLSFGGNYVVARTLFGGVVRALASDVTVATEALSEQECIRQLAYTNFDAFKLTRQVRDMISQPPFVTQSNHLEQIAHVDSLLVGLEASRDPESIETMRATYDALAQGSLHWLQRHHRAGFHLEVLGDLVEAERIWRGILAELPQFAMARSYLAGALAKQKRYREAQTLWQESLAMDPYQADVHNNLANCILALRPDDDGAYNEAIEHYRTAHRMSPSPNSLRNINLALLQRATRWAQGGETERAKAQLLEIVQSDADFAQAQFNLAVIATHEGDRAEAMRRYREVLRVLPDHPQARQNLRDLGG